MKSKNPNSRTLKLIASHALVAAVFTQPYVIYVWGDIYNIIKSSLGLATEQITAPAINENLIASMSFLSDTALLVSAVFFGLYLWQRDK
jgi:hypothetical protein